MIHPWFAIWILSPWMWVYVSAPRGLVIDYREHPVALVRWRA